MPKNKGLQKALSRIVASAGGDAQDVVIPDTRRALDVMVHSAGEHHVLVVAPENRSHSHRRASPSLQDYVDSGAGETLVKGRVACLNDALWLMAEAGWSFPLITPAEYPETRAVLQASEGGLVTMWGIFTDDGLVVSRFAPDARVSRISRFVNSLDVEECRLLARLVQRRLARKDAGGE